MTSTMPLLASLVYQAATQIEQARSTAASVDQARMNRVLAVCAVSRAVRAITTPREVLSIARHVAPALRAPTVQTSRHASQCRVKRAGTVPLLHCLGPYPALLVGIVRDNR